MKQKVIIDCDPGIDDALTIAMALASSSLEVVGITTVAGNREVEKTTTNALRTLEYFGKLDVPVFVGAAKPLTRALHKPGVNSSHGQDGLGDTKTFFPHPKLQSHPDAVSFLERQIKANPGQIAILAIGPLTNIALLLRRINPKDIRELVLMNGVFWEPGNATKYAEYNAFIDPEAAHEVYSSPISIRAAGLDVTNPLAMTRSAFAELCNFETREARFIKTIFDWAFASKVRERYNLFWDVVALLWLLDPALVVSKRGRVEVVVEGVEDGRTRFKDDPGGNVYIGSTIDRDKFFTYLSEFVATGKLSI